MSFSSNAFSQNAFSPLSFFQSLSEGAMGEDGCLNSNFSQTLFLGCSIESFTCSLGWGEQSTEVRVKLIEDDCAGSKVYYDITDSSPQKTHTGADPGFFSYGAAQDEAPRLGSPVYFRFADFEYCGLLQSWTQIEPASDKNRYEVLLVGPTALLQGCSVIIGDYNGEVNGFNIVNAFAFQEVVGGTSCNVYNDPTDGPIFGSTLGGFGGASRTEAGMPYNKIHNAIHCLTSAIPNSAGMGYGEYSAYGRIIYHGANTNAAYGLIPRDSTSASIGSLWGLETGLAEYLIDLSDMPVVPDDYRLQGTSIDLLSLVTQVCTDFGHDYYLEIVPIRIDDELYKIIKVRTVSRVAQPALGVVSDFISNVSAGSGIISSSYGEELRNESNSTFLIGGAKRSIWEVYNGFPASDPDDAFLTAKYGANAYVRDRVVPYYGSDTTGNPNVLYEDAGGTGVTRYYVNVDFSVLTPHLNTLGGYLSTHAVTIGEMQAAAAGFDSWTSTSQNLNTDLYQTLDAEGIVINGLWRNLSDLTGVPSGRLAARDYVNTIGNITNADPFVREDLKAIQEYIGDLYNTSKQKFMVRLPYTCVTANNGRIETTDTPADGGWTEKSTLLGLANPGGALDFFKNEDGSIGSLAVFSGSGLSPLDLGGTKYYYPNGNFLYVETQVDPNLVFLDNYTKRSPRVLVSIPEIDQIAQSFRHSNAFDKQTTAINNALVGTSGALSHNTGLLSTGLEKELLNYGLAPEYFEPFGLAVPMKSNVHTYGPWAPSNVIEAGPPGRVNIQQDDSLVPWTYGSLSALGSVAQTQCNASVTAMVYGEVGEITTNGYPTTPLGSELGSVIGLASKFYGSNNHLFENRVYADSTITVGGIDFDFHYMAYGVWDGAYGPNVTNISITVDTQGIQTSYSFRTFSPKFGHLARLNAERVAQRTQAANYIRGQARMQNFIQNVQHGNAKQLSKILKQADKIYKQNERKSSSSSMGVFVAGLTPTQSGIARRPIMSAKRIDQLQEDTDKSERYDNTAVMSLDGLLRPVSLFGEGGLPRLARTKEDNYHYTHVNGPAYNNDPQHYEHKLNYYFSNHTPLYASPPHVYSPELSKYLNRRTIGSLAYNPLSNLYTGDLELGNVPSFMGSGGGINGGSNDIDIVARRTLDTFNTGSGLERKTSLSRHTAINTTNATLDDAEDYRFMALRGPLMMQGWGYDLNGKPIPNRADTPDLMSSGLFVTTGLHDFFHSGFLNNSDYWPLAPIDLRYDRKRNVWTAPTQPTPVFGFHYLDGTGTGINNGIQWNWADITVGTAAQYDEEGNTTLPTLLSAVRVKGNSIYPDVPVYSGEALYAFPPTLSSYFGDVTLGEGTYDRSNAYDIVGQDHTLNVYGYQAGQIHSSEYQLPIFNRGVRHMGFGSGFYLDDTYVTSWAASIMHSGDPHTLTPYPEVRVAVNLSSGLKYNEDGSIYVDEDYVIYWGGGGGGGPDTTIELDKDNTNIATQGFDPDGAECDRLTFTDSFLTDGSSANVKVQAGLLVSTSTDCFSQSDEPDSDNRYYKIEMARGLIVDEVDDVQIRLNAGVLVTTNQQADARDIDFVINDNTDANLNQDIETGPLFNEINIGQGINVDSQPGTPCKVELGAGVHMEDGTETIVEHNDNLEDKQFYPIIRVGKGLSYELGQPFEQVQLGLDLKVNTYQTAEMTFYSPFEVTDNGNGDIDIDLKLGCGLEVADWAGGLTVDVSDLIGCGLKREQEEACRISVDNYDLAGAGLMPAGQCQLAVNPDDLIWQYIVNNYVDVNVNVIINTILNQYIEEIYEELLDQNKQTVDVVTDIEQFEVVGNELILKLKRETLTYIGEAPADADPAQESVGVDEECA